MVPLSLSVLVALVLLIAVGCTPVNCCYWCVFAFGLLLAAAAILLFGLVPALRASGVSPAGALKKVSVAGWADRLARFSPGGSDSRVALETVTACHGFVTIQREIR